MAFGIPEGFEEVEEEEEETPPGFESTDDPLLGEIRTSFLPELDNPQIRELLAASTLAEVGDQPEHVQQSYMETVMNRAAARRISLSDTVLDQNYYPGITHARMSRKMGNFADEEMQRLDKMIDNVVKGSNITNYATGNESGDVHSGGAPVSYDPQTGERFVQENPDREWVEQVSTGKASPAQIPEGFEEVEVEEPKIPEGFEEVEEDRIPLEGEKKSFFATEEEEKKWGGRGPKDPTRMAEEAADLTPSQAKGAANRKELQGAIAKVEKEGYTVPHFIGLPNEPEGDRAPTRDMEQLVATLATQQTNAVRARDIKEAARIGKERAYWENKIRTEGMSAEQWKKQTGEEDPRYPHEPAFTAKQSPEGLVNHVETGINAAKKNWESTEEGALRRGLRIAGLGLGETVNRYAYSPIVHGIREAIDYIAPGSDLAKTAKNLDDAFYKNTVEIPHQQRTELLAKSAKEGTASEVVTAVGQMAGDLPSIMLTGGLLPELKTGIELVNALRHGAAAMTVPAMRAGTDAAEEVKKKGGTEMEQFGAFVRGTTLMMGIGAFPMATKSGAASRLGRFAERAAKSIPLASAAVESARMADNLTSDIFGGEKHPFSLEEHIKGALPMVLVGGVAGRSTAKSKFERTFGFNPTHLDKAEWMRRRMDAEGLAKATPEKVMEWDAEWKKQEGVWPEEAETQRKAAELREAPPVTPEQRGIYRTNEKTPRHPEDELVGTQSVEMKGKTQNVYTWISKEAPAPVTEKPAQAREVTPEAAEFAPPAETLEQLKAAPIKRSPQALGIVADPRATKGFEAARDEAKAIADYLNKAEHWGPWNSAVGNKVAADQKAYDNVMRQSEALKKLAPDAEARKGATMYREADGDMKKIVAWGTHVKDAVAKKAYRAAGALKPNELALVDKVAQRFKELNMLLNAHGIDVAEIENYVTHMFHTSGVEPMQAASMRSVSSFFKYAKPRRYDSYFQAIQAGEKPKNLDIVDILSAYEVQAMRAINNKKFVDRLKFGQARDGRNILAPSSIQYTPKGQGYKFLDAPGLERSRVHPDYFKDLSKILGHSKIQEWLEERSRNPFVNYGKGALRAAIEGQKYAKGTMFSLSAFHQGTEDLHAFGHRVNPYNTKPIDLNDPKQYDAAVHGLMLRPDKASQEQFMMGVGGKTNYNLVTKVARKFGGPAGRRMADLIDGYSHWLFETHIPRLKFSTYEHILERNMGRFAKELKEGKVSPSEVKSLSADQANAAYGHLNYTKMARSPTIQQALQIAFLAPDFFEARAQFAGQAMKGLVGSKTGTEQLVALAYLGIGQYVVARILNKLDHDDYEWDPEHVFQVKTDLNGLLPDKRWIGLRSVPEDIHKSGLTSLAAFPFTGDYNKPFKEASQFIRHRAAPFIGLATDNLYQHNWKGEKTDFGKSIGDMLSNVVPMPMQGYVERMVRPDAAQAISPFETLLKSTGIQIHRVSPLSDTHKLAADWLKVNDPDEYDRREASTFPASQYLRLRYALEDSNKELARAEAKRLSEKAGEPIGSRFQQSVLNNFTRSLASDQRFYESLDKHDKAIFDAAIKRRALILERYKAWVGPLGTKTGVTEVALHRRMREAKVEEMKKARKRR